MYHVASVVRSVWFHKEQMIIISTTGRSFKCPKFWPLMFLICQNFYIRSLRKNPKILRKYVSKWSTDSLTPNKIQVLILIKQYRVYNRAPDCEKYNGDFHLISVITSNQVDKVSKNDIHVWISSTHACSSHSVSSLFHGSNVLLECT